MTKRIFAMVLALMLALSLCSAAMADNAEETANTAATDLLTSLKIVKGMPDGSLELARNVTRAEAATLMTRAKLGEDGINALTASQSSFNDVNTNFWAAKEIDYCAKNKIIAGDGRGNFFPNNNVTMNELMAISLRTLGYGDFVGKDWEKEVDETASQLPTFSNLSRTSKPAVREDVFETIYQSLFTPQKTASGQTAATLATQHAVAVVKVGDNRACFTVNGVKLDGVYNISADAAFPVAGTVNLTKPVSDSASGGEPCVLLEISNSDGVYTARLLMTDGTVKEVKPGNSASGYWSGVGTFALWNADAKQLTLAESSKGKADLTKGAAVLDGVAIDSKTVFLVRTVTGSKESFKRYTGAENVPTTYEAEYCSHTAADGILYVYISSGKATKEEDGIVDGYTGSARVFLADPRYCGEGVTANDNDRYFFTDGAIDGQIGEVRLNKSLEGQLDGMSPGLYMGAYFRNGLITNLGMEYYGNPLAVSMFGEASANKSYPVKGIKLESGNSVVRVGTNPDLQEITNTSGAAPYELANTSAKAFCFNVGGSTKRVWTCLVSEIKDDDNAYVWATVTTEGKVGNLYIIYGADSSWKDTYTWPW